MRKIWTSFLAVILVLPLMLQTTAHANSAINVYIDGSPLKTDQAPIMVQGRVMLPLRAIFEALNATVKWDQKAQIVTAIKGDTTIVLKIKSKVATINNEAVTLDVPAQSIKGRTMVPVRFVSEALGQEVGWNSKTKRVTITSGDNGGTTNPGNPIAVSYVSLRDNGSNGDGRDLEVGFAKSSNEASAVDHYRVYIVKAGNVSSFNLNAASKVSPGNYSTLLPTGNDQSLKLLSSTRDVDGAVIKANQSYVAFVLAVGKGNGTNALSGASAAVMLDSSISNSVAAATNVKASDVSDYGDGRDITVSFTRPQNDSNISSYRVFIVKTRDVSSFNLSTANNASSQSYTVVNKTGSNTSLTGTLSSSTRDTSGELIKNGVAYTAYVLSISNTTVSSNKLSTGSSSFTLNANAIPIPVITQVKDQSNYGDGRDLRISFNKISDESKISGYRVFIVKASNYTNFNLSKANLVSSSNYTTWNKKNGNFDQSLSSSTRDVDGATIRSGVSYRLFVMAVGSGSYAGTNSLSSASSEITLSNNSSIGVVSNLSVSDYSDNNDGRDLHVSFTRPSDESNISHYRILVVRTSNVGSFTESKANATSYYTQANVGSNYSQVLASGAKDVDGYKIQNGISYTVYVLSVGKGSYSGSYVLSAKSNAVTLSQNNNAGKASNVTVNDINDYKDGRDLEVAFTRASDEYNISHYRIMVVKSSNWGSFDLAKANAVYNSSNYTQVSKRGDNIKTVLSSGARDVDGAAIRNDVPYRVFVLSVGNGSNNALSPASREITLSTNNSVLEVSGLSASVDGNTGSFSDIKVSFNKVADESRVSEYRILIVPASSVNNFKLQDANNVTVADNYTRVTPKGTNVSQSLRNSRDAYGNAFNMDTTYQVVVLTVAKSGTASNNALSSASNQVKAKPNPDTVSVSAVSDARVVSGATGITVSFTEPTAKQYISEYAIIAVPKGTAFNLAKAQNAYYDGKVTKVRSGAAQTVTQNVYGGVIDTARLEYDIYILSVPDMINAKIPALSSPFSTGLYAALAPTAVRRHNFHQL
ncbi:hypothetical protein D3C76_506620 [compost metagenome]